MSAIGWRAAKSKVKKSMVKKNMVKKQDTRIAIMVDRAAACVDITAAKNHQIIASQSLSIPIPNEKPVDITIDDPIAAIVATAVDDFCQQHQLKNPACTLMLPASSYQMLLVEAPPVKQEELAEALQWKVKDLINTAMEDSIIDGFLLPDDAYRGRQKMAYAVVANRAELQLIANSLKTINVDLDRIEVPELVLLRLLEEYPRESHTEMIVVVGRQGGFLMVVADQALYLSRVNDISEQALEAETERNTETERNSNGVANNRQVEHLILEIQRSRDYFESQIGKGTIDRILLAPIQSFASNLSSGVQERLGVSVELIDPSVITEFTLARQGGEGLLLASAAKAA